MTTQYAPLEPHAAETSAAPYPVHVDARLDDHLSRGLWLIKWILALPHILVLIVLWAGYLVASLIAWLSILIVGSYPRWAFTYTTGVLRWGWRVQYYACNVLGTDRYPPFTLADVPDYPARLTIDYPEHPSRGLALFQWWLLPIPHFLILCVIVGTSSGYHRGANTFTSPGLLGLLTLVAGFALLFTGVYPKELWRFVMGLNRWVLRVVAYTSLMTDRYPPFRLDQGGTEPDTVTAVVPSPETRYGDEVPPTPQR